MKRLGWIVLVGSLVTGCGGAVGTSSTGSGIPDYTPTPTPGEETPTPTPDPGSPMADLKLDNFFVASSRGPSDAYEPNDAQPLYLGGSGFLYQITQGRIEPVDAEVVLELRNAGAADAGAFEVDLFLDAPAPSSGQRGAIQVAVPALPAGAATSVTFRVPANAAAAQRKAVAKADAAEMLPEEDESDNLSPVLDVALPGRDVDWFSADARGGTTLQVALGQLPADYDLELYNQNGTRVAFSANDGTANESISYAVPASARYYVKVFGYEGAADANANYRLDVTVP